MPVILFWINQPYREIIRTALDVEIITRSRIIYNKDSRILEAPIVDADIDWTAKRPFAKQWKVMAGDDDMATKDELECFFGDKLSPDNEFAWSCYENEDGEVSYVNDFFFECLDLF